MPIRPLTRALVAVLATAVFAAPAAHAQYSFTEIFLPGALGITAADVNNLGQVVGDYVEVVPGQAGPLVGYLYDQGTYTLLRAPGPSMYTRTSVQGINDAGQVVGYCGSIEFPGMHGFLYSEGVYTTIDVPGSSATMLGGINNAGQIVGAYLGASGMQAFLYEHGTFTLLDFDSARDINDRGEIVGYKSAAALTHGIVADAAGLRLFDVPGAMQTIASGIDNAGRIVGSTSNSSFLYSAGTLTPIAVPGLRALLVLGTNDGGQIVGTATDAATSRAVAFLATPVAVTATPEPATLSLIGAGVAVLGAVTRRRPRA